MCTKFWAEKVKEEDHLEDLGIDQKIILEWKYGNRVGRGELDSSGFCEHDNEPAG
jgi:hypothetical protein